MTESTQAKIVLKVLTGSRAYGLERENSDWDYHAVHIAPTSDLLKLGPAPKGHVWDESKDEDRQTWEIGHFLHLATRCNPTILETFVAPAVQLTLPFAPELRSLLPYVLNRKRIHDSFLGYAHNQRTKLFKKPDDPTKDQPTDRAWKFATQYMRVLIVGEALLRTGELVIDMAQHGPGEYTVNFLRDVRHGNFSLGNVVDRAAKLEAQLKAAYEKSEVQETGNLDAINEFLLRVRIKSW